MNTSTAMSLPEQIEQLFEPAARAARRGDADQIQRVLKALRGIWQKSAKQRAGKKADQEMARGMTFAIEGLLGIILASAGADARHALLGRKHAVPILHVLGKKARQALSGAPNTESDAGVQMGDLARAVGAQPQNIGELVYSMRDCGLVNVEEEGQVRRVTLTEAGIQMLEANMPGWQVLDLEQQARNEELRNELRKIQESIHQTLARGRGEAGETEWPRLETKISVSHQPTTRWLTHIVRTGTHKVMAAEIERLTKHTLYDKFIWRNTRLFPNDQESASQHDRLSTISPHEFKLYHVSEPGDLDVADTGKRDLSVESLRDNVIAAFTLDARR
jgi:hypothetical protein